MTANPSGGLPALDVEGLARRFGMRWALRNATLRVEPGEVVALVGRNGSGKTTFLRLIATVLRPSRGSGRVFGHDLMADPASIRPLIGLLGHLPGLYEDLTASENLAFALKMLGMAPDRWVIDDVLDRVALANEANERVRGFSAGMRRRLALARIMLRPPRLLMLDEPYASFDTEGVALVNHFVAEVSRAGGAVLIATHDLARAGDLPDQVVRIVGGRMTLESARGANAGVSADDADPLAGQEHRP